MSQHVHHGRRARYALCGGPGRRVFICCQVAQFHNIWVDGRARHHARRQVHHRLAAALALHPRPDRAPAAADSAFSSAAAISRALPAAHRAPRGRLGVQQRLVRGVVVAQHAPQQQRACRVRGSLQSAPCMLLPTKCQGRRSTSATQLRSSRQNVLAVSYDSVRVSISCTWMCLRVDLQDQQT